MANKTIVGDTPQGRVPQNVSHEQEFATSREVIEKVHQHNDPFHSHFTHQRLPFWTSCDTLGQLNTILCLLGNEDIAIFLLRHGAFFCSYILLDSPDPSKHLLRKYFIEASALSSSCPGKMVSSHCLWIKG